MQLNSYIETLGGSSEFNGDGEKPLAVLATFDEMDPLLLEETDRYSVEGTHDDTSYDYTFTISGILILFLHWG